MNLLPEKMPVKVYTSQDKNAPLLDKSPNCMATIFKACLITGYGDKAGAGWTMPFEDSQKGIKVFRPPISAEQDFYLRVSQDNGKTMLAQVYTSMTDINTGELKLQLDNVFNYAKTNNTGKWVMIVSPRGFWFLTEQYYYAGDGSYGAYFFVGDTAPDDKGQKGIWLAHTSGTDANIFTGVQEANVASLYASASKIYLPMLNMVKLAFAESWFTGRKKIDIPILANVASFTNGSCYVLPGIFSTSAGPTNKNGSLLGMDGRSMMAYNTASNELQNHYFATDYWEY